MPRTKSFDQEEIFDKIKLGIDKRTAGDIVKTTLSVL